ncbi:MAG: diguanylate cyclase/phosphodiesterase (GGDEF & EAL domains) with PAS/PAC sensor(s) [uncultured Rubrobacteraceae bacterium]|uniref:Diguanylate cyclase/phosphodiesterase (GGDEF & EAL domains) with PAS/PAC sensor(S) n=1 Tax=uncultured Rubrobacteraceae bacterium TaxID=349277 RepID=A0A6J4QYY0_9ACTN|nr:MAG: diguanylate cyclase/phosphodiesterase (GGDEF & EAL domains) with PAS/PAC sensor(s) [uncultured Rubrobacteraceae bacterium]
MDKRESKIEGKGLYEALVEAQNEAGEGFVVAEGERIFYANQAYSKISGYSLEELLALPSLYDLVVPEQRELLLERFRERLSGQRVIDRYESAITHKSGRRVEIEIVVKLFREEPSKRVLIIREITERKRADEALRETEERFRQLFEQSVDALLVHDEKGRMVDCNAEACRSLGYSREELLSLSVKDFATNLLSEEEKVSREGSTLWQGAMAGEPGAGAEGFHFGEHRRKDGTTFPVEVHVGAVDYGGKRMILASARDITERKQANEALRKSEERFRSLVQNATDHVAVIDANGTITYESPSVERVLGYKPEERIGTNAFDYVHPEDLERMRRDFAEGLRATGTDGKKTTGTKFEARLRHADSSWRRLEAVASNLLADPNIEGIVINSRDVTERRRDEEALRKQNEYLDALNETSLALMNRLELPDLLEVVVARAGAMVDTSHGHVYLVESGEAELEMQVGVGVFDKYVGLRLKIGECVPGQVWESEQPLVVDDYRTWPGRSPRFSKEDFRAAVGLPLKSGSEVVGVIGLSRLEEGRTFGNDEVELLSRFARQASVALDNARLYTRVQRELAERERTEAALRESEEQYRTLVEAVQEGIGFVDSRETVTYCNQAYAAVFDLTPQELVGRSLLDFLDEKQRRKALDQTALRKNNVRSSYEISITTGEGRRKDLSASGTPIMDAEGSLQGVVHAVIDITERKALEEQLAYQAFHDPLTGLSNRTLFMDRLEHALARVGRSKDSVAVMFLDLDNFKVVNDSLGHEVGDRLLVVVSERLQPCLRPGDTIARLGGDEFTVLLEHIGSVSEATRVAERIAEAVQKPFTIDGQELFVTFSIGITFSRSDKDRPGDLLRDADLAMYQAKGSGKARYEVFDPSMNTRALERLELSGALRRALEREEFRVCYQPKVKLATRELFGLEALVRWKHPQRGLVSPSEFIPIAEETGLILPIGQWVLEEACNQAKEWQEQYPSDPPLKMSVNFSARQLQHPQMVQNITRTLGETGIDPRDLILEITESVVMENAPSTIATLRKLEELGLRIAIDDFGTGYSSLSYLKRLPVSLVKIDRSFVEGLREEPKDAALVSGIISLSHKLGMQVIAEGVETAEQFAQLRELGCDLAQGNYFGEPVSGRAATAFLAKDLRW